MKNLAKPILVILLSLAVMGYTVYNYTIGQTSLINLFIFMAILAFPVINMIGILVDELRK